LAALRRSGGVAPHSGKAFSSGPYFLKPFLVCTPKTFSVVNTKGKKGIQFNKGLYSRGNANLSDVVSVKLSFDPNNPKSRQNDWFWGDGKERLSISFRKHNGRRKTVSLKAWKIRGGCDALATFAEQLQMETETSADSNTKSAKRV
jgi:hypothetical protein